MRTLVGLFKYLPSNNMLGRERKRLKTEGTTHITPAASYALNVDERHALEHQAIRGDSGAAIKLATYYALAAIDVPVEERKKQELVWWECAAKHRNILAIKTLIGLFIERNDFSRARHWLHTLPQHDKDRSVFEEAISQKSPE